MSRKSHQHNKFEELPGQEALELPENRPGSSDKLKIICGPLLRYWGTDNAQWRGSVIYVTDNRGSDYDQFPAFQLAVADQQATVDRHKLYAVNGFTFWRYDFAVPQADKQLGVTYTLGKEHKPYQFFVPGVGDEMNIMFYSCNGFSLSTDTSTFPASLWKDVLRKHNEKPFNVMLGGGDQLYCDSIQMYLPVFKKWTSHNLSRQGFMYQPTDKEKEGMDVFYLKTYVEWFGRGYWKGLHGETLQSLWVEALAVIPMVNIYDDHDIIDGWGSYKDSTMRSPMFQHVGYYAQKYYFLFQHGINPMDDADPKHRDPSWALTGRKGPYMPFEPRSIYARLGKSVAFYGLDCRTERAFNQVCTPAAYDAMFSRLEKELTENKEIRHALIMLGVPIAYPRMVWAEHLMSSGLLAPIKWLARHKIVLSGLVNEFDGQVELLDDLNDHWCAYTHKKERNRFVLRIQELAKKTSVRFTILTGDVHLCGVGRFQTKGSVPPENDPRYIICPISSAITNTPPPEMLADFMNRRNKNHYLGENVEDMVHIFEKDVDGSHRNNHTTLARRNYCILRVGQGETSDSLSMSLQVEKDSKDTESVTVPYAMTIPALETGRAAANKAVPNSVGQVNGQANGHATAQANTQVNTQVNGHAQAPATAPIVNGVNGVKQVEV